MKHIIISISALCMLLSCKENGNKGVVKNEEVKVVNKSYKAEDGSRAKVTFETKNGVETLIIYANGKTIALDKNLGSVSGDMYGRDGIVAHVFGDSIKIEQGNNIISLGLDK